MITYLLGTMYIRLFKNTNCFAPETPKKPKKVNSHSKIVQLTLSCRIALAVGK